MTFGIIQLLAGTGLMLFAMHLLEDSLKNLAGRSFKLLLNRLTRYTAGAVLGGMLVTAILQSSSVVSLMVLAFAGAGLFSLKKALALVLGANLGTTLTGWLVAVFGFRLEISYIAYPALIAGGLMIMFIRQDKKIKDTAGLLTGFGLLFTGLAMIKLSMETEVSYITFSRFSGYPLMVFLLAGFLFTVIVQSSSVTMALALSAIHSGALSFTPAAAMMLGAECGTTIKLLLVSVNGNAIKKRLAFSNFGFNVVIAVLIFLLIKPVIYFISGVLNIMDPLIGLVTFSTLVNIVSILFFIPLLHPVSDLLTRIFPDTGNTSGAYLTHANINEPQSAFTLFEKETAYFIYNAILFNLMLFDLKMPVYESNSDFEKKNALIRFGDIGITERYNWLKIQQGALQSFYLRVRGHLAEDRQARLNQLISSARSAMHSVKSMKDISSNLQNLKSSSKSIKYDFFMHHKVECEDLYKQLLTIMQKESTETYSRLSQLYQTIEKNYSSALAEFYTAAHDAHLEDLDLTNAIGFNRELFTSNKAMLFAIKDYLLEETQAQQFNEMVVYKT